MYICMKVNIDKISYDRDYEDVHKKDIEFEALLISTEHRERLHYYDWFERQRIPRQSNSIPLGAVTEVKGRFPMAKNPDSKNRRVKKGFISPKYNTSHPPT